MQCANMRLPSNYFSTVIKKCTFAISVIYSFPGSAIMNCHKLGGLKQQRCILSQFWGLIPKSICQQSYSFLECSREESFLLPHFLVASRNPWHPLACSCIICITHLAFIWRSLGIWGFLFFSYKDTSHRIWGLL